LPCVEKCEALSAISGLQPSFLELLFTLRCTSALLHFGFAPLLFSCLDFDFYPGFPASLVSFCLLPLLRF
jgi:hypothetical protein